jgi:hypothetical protein
MQRETEAASPKHGSIEITVDGRPITLDDPETTPNEVLRLAGPDPATTTSCVSTVDTRSRSKVVATSTSGSTRGEKVVSVSTGPTPVS